MVHDADSQCLQIEPNELAPLSHRNKHRHVTVRIAAGFLFPQHCLSIDAFNFTAAIANARHHDVKHYATPHRRLLAKPLGQPSDDVSGESCELIVPFWFVAGCLDIESQRFATRADQHREPTIAQLSRVNTDRLHSESH
ncbi:uncharacterized protein CLUP02_14099 [Colletotrichum lupini]|uniref:Uncharacterized protein n=1 Tax=Colletotrichum lupini TaxID=145971 RepID=A0A9Q8T3D9_9PEZI|nr:uncharacterized protein CLUP02_14099 [Colletotrichum lupini]UQC88574.1 hypothetical protein CLUP02_14099 [Colletotrichum lupini]